MPAPLVVRWVRLSFSGVVRRRDAEVHPRQTARTGVQVLGQLDDGLGSRGLRVCRDDWIALVAAPVSYTHLTLPTIDSV